ncbi:unnamed protein product, partial [marine sediment metagenome]
GGHWPRSLRYKKIVAYDITKPRWGLTCTKGYDRVLRIISWKTINFEQLWSFKSNLRVHIKAGSRLYGGKKGLVAAVDIPKSGGEPKVSWEAKIDGTPSTMLAAGDKLFVVTRQGRIYCFGGKEVETKTYAIKKPSSPSSDEWTRRAGEILKQSGVTQGYCLALGLGTGRLVEELALQSGLHIIALESDIKKVDAARSKLNAAGLYGARIHILPQDLLSLRLPPYMASLVVSENLERAGFEKGRAFTEKLFYSMRPYGGVAYLPVPQEK